MPLIRIASRRKSLAGTVADSNACKGSVVTLAAAGVVDWGAAVAGNVVTRAVGAGVVLPAAAVMVGELAGRVERTVTTGVTWTAAVLGGVAVLPLPKFR